MVSAIRCGSCVYQGNFNSDVGRQWNRGLAFYGWLFYLSKFYEVVDTLIILARSKRGSFLQIYHPVWSYALHLGRNKVYVTTDLDGM